MCAIAAHLGCGGDSAPSAPVLDNMAQAAEEIVVAPDSLTATVKWKNIGSTELTSGVEVEQSFSIEFNNLLDFPITLEIANLEIIDVDGFLVKAIELNRTFALNARSSSTISIAEKMTYSSVAIANSVATFRFVSSIHPVLHGIYYNDSVYDDGRGATVVSFREDGSYSYLRTHVSFEPLEIFTNECNGTYEYVKPQLKESGRCSDSEGDSWDYDDTIAIELHLDRWITSGDEEFVGTSDRFEFRICGESCDDELADFNKWLAEQEQLAVEQAAEEERLAAEQAAEDLAHRGLQARLDGRYAQRLLIIDNPWTATGAGQEIDIVFAAEGMSNVKQFELRLEFNPANVIDFERSTFVATQPFLQPPPSGTELTDAGEWRLAGVILGAEASESSSTLGTLKLVTAENFDATTEVVMRVTFFSIGPSFSDREDYTTSDLGIEVVINDQ